jgi:glycosyltransferase involved in cell wall biosynthesis
MHNEEGTRVNASSPLISVGLPVRNGAHRVQTAIESVLAQDYEHLELVICDNASTDSTEEICREFARSDERIGYHRHAENIGLMNNFVTAMRLARGEFFRWISYDDRLEPNCLSRCAEVLTSDERLLLVTSQILYELDDGALATEPYQVRVLGSNDPADRFAEWLRLLTESFLLLDPMYSLMRRARVVGIHRKNTMREDELFAAKMALTGPWGHVPEVLAMRHWNTEAPGTLARKLEVPVWNSMISPEIECFRLLNIIARSELDTEQRRRARRAVARLFSIRLRRRAVRAVRKASSYVRAHARPRAA